ncbi:MAG TPA: hypothetical protein VGE74_01015 [Gemmata sp.]
MLFGGQSIPYRPRTAHTWATFVKATPTADGSFRIEHVTISWLPAAGPVQPLRLRSVAGKNHSLDETFAKMRNNDARVSVWGPFETDATRYALAAQQADVLNSGAVRFRSVDSFRNNRGVQNCTHAVTYADPNLQHLRQPVPVGYGEPGTSKLAAKYVNSGAVAGAETHDWVLSAVGADQYPVVRRAPGEHISRRRR